MLTLSALTAAPMSAPMSAPVSVVVGAVTGPSFMGGFRIGLLVGIVLVGVALPVVARQPARAWRLGGVLLSLVSAMGIVQVIDALT